MNYSANPTIFGSSTEAFASCVALLNARDALWSSVCDKKGDWLISMTDDSLTDAILGELIEMPGVYGVSTRGEITVSLERHPEYDAIMAGPMIWEPEPGDEIN